MVGGARRGWHAGIQPPVVVDVGVPGSGHVATLAVLRDAGGKADEQMAVGDMLCGCRAVRPGRAGAAGPRLDARQDQYLAGGADRAHPRPSLLPAASTSLPSGSASAWSACRWCQSSSRSQLLPSSQASSAWLWEVASVSGSGNAPRNSPPLRSSCWAAYLLAARALSH